MYVLHYKKKDTYFTRIREELLIDERVGSIKSVGWEIVAILELNSNDYKLYSINDYFSRLRWYQEIKKPTKWERIKKILFEKQQKGEKMGAVITAITTALTVDKFFAIVADLVPFIVVMVPVSLALYFLRKLIKGAAKGKVRM